MKKIYNWAIVLLPVLSMYRSVFAGVDLATLTMAAIFLYYFFFCEKNLPTNKLQTKKQLFSPTKIFITAAVLLTVFSLIFTPIFDQFVTDKKQMALRFAKFVFLASTVLTVGRDYFDFSIAANALKKVVFAAVLYVTAQFLCFYAFDIVLPPFIKGLTVQDYSYLLDAKYHHSLGLFRPMSFFYEPAHFSEYCICYLCICLYGSHIPKAIPNAAFTTFGIILSTSGIGVLLCLVMWFGAAIVSIAKDDKYSGIYFLLFATAIVSLPLLLKIPFLQKAWQRLIFIQDLGVGAGALRLGAGYDVLALLGGFRKVVGIGFGNYQPGNAVGFSYLLISFGWLGTALFLLIFLRGIRYHSGFVRAFCVCILVLLFVSPILNTLVSFYLPFVLYYKEKGKTPLVVATETSMAK